MLETLLERLKMNENPKVCNACNGETIVTDSRPHNCGIYRRRKCTNCGAKTQTIEIQINAKGGVERGIKSKLHHLILNDYKMKLIGFIEDKW